MSRYEGWAPTLVVSEAMASGCLISCSKDSRQEIIEDKENGLIINENYQKGVEKIIRLLKDKEKMKEITDNSLKTIKKLSLEKLARGI